MENGRLNKRKVIINQLTERFSVNALNLSLLLKQNYHVASENMEYNADRLLFCDLLWTWLLHPISVHCVVLRY